MIRPVAILLLLIPGGVAFGRVQPVPVPQPPGAVPRDPDEKPPPRPPRRIRTPGPTPGGPIRFDLHGDPLPPGAIARFGTVRLRHGGEPLALTFSPDAKWLGSLSTTDDGIRLWDTATGKEVARYTSPVTCAVFTRDGRMVIADDSHCKVWHPATNAVREFPSGTIPDGTTALAVHPDCATFVAAAPQKIVLIDVQTGKVRRELKTPGGTATHVAFSRDGRWLAACGQKTGVWLWDTKTGKRLRTYQPGENDHCEFAFSPDGTRIAVATNFLRVYPTDAEEELDGFTPLDEHLFNPTFSGDGTSLFGQLPDGGVKHIDAATGDVNDTWDAPDGENKRQPVALAAGGALAAGTDPSGGIRVWTPKTGKGPEVDRLTMLYDPGLSADGKTAACLDAVSRLHQFDPLSGKPGKVIRLPVGEEVPVSWDPCTRRAAAILNGEATEIQIIDVDAGKVTVKFPAPADTPGLPSVAFNPADRTRLAVFSPGSVTIAHAATGRTIRTIAVGVQSNPSRGAFSPDGRLIAVTPALGVWEVSTGKKRFGVELANARDVVFSPDGRLLAAWDTSDTIVLFDLRTGTTVRRFQLPNADGSLSCVAFSPDGKRVVTGDQTGVIVLWDVATAEALLVLDRHDGQVTAVCFNADGTRLLSTANDGTALYWDVSTRPPPEAAAPTVGGLDDAFNLLGSADAAHAHRGMEHLYRRRADAVKLFAEKLAVPKPVAADRIAKFVADLDSDDFLTRTTAAKELGEIGGEAGAALRTAAEKSPSAEVRRAATDLAAKVDAAATRPDDLRVLRAVEVLEHVGTPAARDVLAAWAAGPPGHRQTVEAAAAVARLK